MGIKLRRNLPALSFGVNTNVVITDIDIDPVIWDGSRSNAYFSLTFTELNEKGRGKKESKVSLGYLPDVNRDGVFKNIVGMCYRVTSLLNIYMSPEEWMPKFNAVFVDVATRKGPKTFETLEEVEQFNWGEEQIYEVFDRIAAITQELLADKIGMKSDPVSVKLVFNKKGNALIAPKYGPFYEAYSGDDNVTLKVNQYDLATKTGAGATRDTLNAGTPAIEGLNL